MDSIEAVPLNMSRSPRNGVSGHYSSSQRRSYHMIMDEKEEETPFEEGVYDLNVVHTHSVPHSQSPHRDDGYFDIETFAASNGPQRNSNRDHLSLDRCHNVWNLSPS